MCYTDLALLVRPGGGLEGKKGTSFSTLSQYTLICGLLQHVLGQNVKKKKKKLK